MSGRRIVLGSAATRGMARGIEAIVAAVRPTLGPTPRLVAVDRCLPGQPPEWLDSGATVARRIVQLADRNADVGAMYVRHLLCHLDDTVGDGTATAAVLLQAVFRLGLRHLATGGSPFRLRHYLDLGAQLLLQELDAMTRPVTGKKRLSQVALAFCGDPQLADVLGEAFDVIGQYGQLELRAARSRTIEREYVEGMYWRSEILSREMLTDRAKLRVTVDNAAILLTDIDIVEPSRLMAIADLALQRGAQALVVVAGSLSAAAIAVLIANQSSAGLGGFAVKPPGLGAQERATLMHDVAILTGARPLTRDTGARLDRVRLSDLGFARRAWADRFYFGVVGGGGDPRALRQHLAGLRAQHDGAPNVASRTGLRERIGSLMGGAATVSIGGVTENQMATRRAWAERAANVLRSVIAGGVVPGGGSALLTCARALEPLRATTDPDQLAACRILEGAVAEPLRTIAANAGYDPAEAVWAVAQGGERGVFDVRSGVVRDADEAGILDATTVVKAALHGAVMSAALALTVDGVVHTRSYAASGAGG